MTTYEETYAQVVAEAEGPAAVAQLRQLEDRYRLAAVYGVRQSEISRIEGGNGNPTLKTIGALARALGAELRLTSA
jgi:transcriptional regulator with XRE-family HTH domain